MARFDAVEGVDAGKRFELRERSLIGRGADSGIRLSDPTVSRKHAMVVDEPRGFFLYDLATRGGTWIDNRPIDSHHLEEGDRIRIGDSILVFRRDPHPQSQDLNDTTVVISEATSGEIMRTLPADDTMTVSGQSAESTSLYARFQKVCRLAGSIGLHFDLERILEEALAAFFDLFPEVGRGVILLLDRSSGNLVPRMVKKRRESLDDRISVPRTILDRVTGNREAVVSTDAMADDRFSGGQSIMMQRVRFVMCSPLLCQDELLGAIYLDSSSFARFTDDDLLVLNGIAAQVAVAIKNAQMNRSLREKEQFERELSIARTIQDSFLPPPTEIPGGWTIASDSIPARQVGGDFFDVLLSGADRLSLVVGDVSGKGVAAALYMASVLSELRVVLGTIEDIERAATAVNEILATRGTMGMFVTVSIVQIDLMTGSGLYVTAGHPEPIVRRCDGTASRLTAETGGPPMGIQPGTTYPVDRFQIDRGETLLLYSDGIYEARDPRGDCYGFERLLETLRESGPEAESTLERIFTDVRSFSAGAGQNDDRTLLVCHREKTQS